MQGRLDHFDRFAAAHAQRRLHQRLDRRGDALADRARQQQADGQQPQRTGGRDPQRALQLRVQFRLRHADGGDPAVLAVAAEAGDDRYALDRAPLERAFGQVAPDAVLQVGAAGLADEALRFARARHDDALAVEDGTGPRLGQRASRQHLGKAAEGEHHLQPPHGLAAANHRHRHRDLLLLGHLAHEGIGHRGLQVAQHLWKAVVLHLGQRRAPVVRRARQALQFGVEQHDVVGCHVLEHVARARMEALEVAVVDAGRGGQRLQHLDGRIEFVVHRLHQGARVEHVGLHQRVTSAPVRVEHQHHGQQRHRHRAGDHQPLDAGADRRRGAGAEGPQRRQETFVHHQASITPSAPPRPRAKKANWPVRWPARCLGRRRCTWWQARGGRRSSRADASRSAPAARPRHRADGRSRSRRRWG